MWRLVWGPLCGLLTLPKSLSISYLQPTYIQRKYVQHTSVHFLTVLRAGNKGLVKTYPATHDLTVSLGKPSYRYVEHKLKNITDTENASFIGVGEMQNIWQVESLQRRHSLPTTKAGRLSGGQVRMGHLSAGGQHSRQECQLSCGSRPILGVVGWTQEMSLPWAGWGVDTARLRDLSTQVCEDTRRGWGTRAVLSSCWYESVSVFYKRHAYQCFAPRVVISNRNESRICNLQFFRNPIKRGN